MGNIFNSLCIENERNNKTNNNDFGFLNKSKEFDKNKSYIEMFGSKKIFKNNNKKNKILPTFIPDHIKLKNKPNQNNNLIKIDTNNFLSKVDVDIKSNYIKKMNEISIIIDEEKNKEMTNIENINLYKKIFHEKLDILEIKKLNSKQIEKKLKKLAEIKKNFKNYKNFLRNNLDYNIIKIPNKYIGIYNHKNWINCYLNNIDLKILFKNHDILNGLIINENFMIPENKIFIFGIDYNNKITYGINKFYIKNDNENKEYLENIFLLILIRFSLYL